MSVSSSSYAPNPNVCQGSQSQVRHACSSSVSWVGLRVSAWSIWAVSGHWDRATSQTGSTNVEINQGKTASIVPSCRYLVFTDIAEAFQVLFLSHKTKAEVVFCVCVLVVVVFSFQRVLWAHFFKATLDVHSISSLFLIYLLILQLFPIVRTLRRNWALSRVCVVMCPTVYFWLSVKGVRA